MKPRPSPLVPVSWGELIDKITILEIKAGKIKAPAALKNVRAELGRLQDIAAAELSDNHAIAELVGALRTANRELWEVEDKLRRKERAKDFGGEFVELARSVYRWNDKRSELKKKINLALLSELVEEKSYEEY